MGAETPQAPPPPWALNTNVNPSHIPNPNPIPAMGRGGGGLYYIVGGQRSLSHFLRIEIIDPVFLGVSWKRERCVTNWVLFRGNLSL